MILLLTIAAASELRPIGTGDTIESIAAERGDPTLAAAIRELNGLGPTEQPQIGTILELPAPKGFHNDQEAFLISLRGEATIADAAGALSPAKVWTPIPNDTQVCTGPETSATMRLASTCNDDGSASDDIVLNSETCLSVQSSFSSAAGRSTVIQITKGSISVAESEDAKGHVTVVTPSGITTGETGGYRVTIEDSASRTEAIDGPVAVAGAGAAVAVKQGQGSRVRTGEIPMEPVDLLPPATLLSPEERARLKRLAFTWAEAPEAFAYRIEMATSTGFTQVLYIEDLGTTFYKPGLLQLPTDGSETVYWRVSAFDRLGFLGLPSEPWSFTLPEAVLK